MKTGKCPLLDVYTGRKLPFLGQDQSLQPQHQGEVSRNMAALYTASMPDLSHILKYKGRVEGIEKCVC